MPRKTGEQTLANTNFSANKRPKHPQIFVTDAEKEIVITKIENSDWAKASFDNIVSKIEPYADRHATDPEWITSRMSMYWEEGKRYTRVYVKNQKFGYGEGNAPVPTVRLPGMRIWNAHGNVPLEDRIPYNDGPMLARPTAENPEPYLVPYEESGHMVRGNNEEIIALAQEAAFLYWITGEEKYAKFAADIYWHWVLGTYYMEPPLDPERSLKGIGGYEPGGICGYYDYEVIHDTLGGNAAVVYDFLHDYLIEHPHPHAVEIGKDVTEISNIVFKRFIEIGFVRGHKSGNWNINGWNCIMNAILALESNDYYPDGKGKEHYLEFYTRKSTPYHDALPDILKDYDPVTGLWHESPGYSLSTVDMLVRMALPIYKAGQDTIGGNDRLKKAALAIIPWLDARGNMVVFGDTRGGPPNFALFERLLTYYTWVGDEKNAATMSTAIRLGMEQGVYDRHRSNWLGILLNVDPLPQGGGSLPNIRTAYSVHHRHITMKNLNDPANGLMATLYGGHPKNDHLSPNGLAMQLYGKGWALAPDSSGYVSYWSDDFGYHRGATGSNTILPGYTAGPITVNAIEPAPAPESFTNTEAISDCVQFADVTADEKRRQVSIIRTSPTTGYYVDIFRSDQPDNDYLYHNLGNEMTLMDAAGRPLSLTSADDLGTDVDSNYRFFANPRKADYSGDLRATWKITENDPPIVMDMWMKGQRGRTVYAVEAPWINRIRHVSPNGVNTYPDSTPTLIVRQRGNNAATAPFVCVFEPYEVNNKSVKSISDFGSEGHFVGILVESNPLSEPLNGRKEYILSSTDNEVHRPLENISFQGLFGVACENAEGFQYLYLGKGTLLAHGKYRIAADAPVSAGLIVKGGVLYYSSTGRIRITLPVPGSGEDADCASWKLFYRSDGTFVQAESFADPESRTITGFVPAGYGIELRMER
jgi:hypothetical protein